jgi:hypothetical protein
VRFTPEHRVQGKVCCRKPAINHARRAFIQNKRYRTNPGAIGDVVNRKAVSVYQTDQVFICIDRVQRRRSVAVANPQ